MAQHRANPIPETVENVPGYPNNLKIYHIPASKYWYARAEINGRRCVRSMRTINHATAIASAKQFYQELLLKQAQAKPLTVSPTFSLVANDLFKEDQGRVDRGERKQSLVDDSRYIFNSDLLDFFGKQHVKDISYQRLNDYVEHLKADREKPVKTKTIKNHFIVLSKILKHAHKLNYIDRLPIFPTLSQQDNPREWFTEPQYARLLKAIDQMIADKVVVRFVPVTMELKYLVTFLVNSFLRPADLKELKHKHIARVTQGNHNYLRIMAMGKTKPAPVITMEAAVAIYADLKAFNKGEDEDYVFFPKLKRAYAMSTMAKQFNQALAVSELKLGPGGQPRTLYSLRHTCIMLRLLKAKNLDVITLARNARTSVEMIQRFYAHHLTAEMNVSKLLTDDAERAITQGSSLEDFLT